MRSRRTNVTLRASWLLASAFVGHLAGCDVGDVTLDLGDGQDAADPDDSVGDDGPEAPPPETWLWRARPGGAGVGRGYGQAFVETDDGGVVVAGWAMLEPSEAGAVWLVRLDDDGGIVWDRLLGSGGEWASALAPHPTGGFLVAGRTSSGTADVAAWIALVDRDGRPVWQRTLNADADAEILAVVPDGPGFYAAGQLGPWITGSEGWIGRLDADGRPLWQRRVVGTCRAGQGSIARSRDGGVLVTTGLGAECLDGLWIAKLDGAGAAVWQRRVATRLSLWNYDPTIHETAEGDVVVTATADGILVLRFDASGTLERGVRVGAGGDQRAGFAVDGPDGGLVLAAMESSFTAERYNLWLFGLSADGRLLWQKSTPNPEPEDAIGLVRSHDGGLLAASGGCCESQLAKLRMDGSFDGACPAFVDTAASVEVADLAADDPALPLEDLALTVAESMPIAVDAASTVELLCRSGSPTP